MYVCVCECMHLCAGACSLSIYVYIYTHPGHESREDHNEGEGSLGAWDKRIRVGRERKNVFSYISMTPPCTISKILTYWKHRGTEILSSSLRSVWLVKDRARIQTLKLAYGPKVSPLSAAQTLATGEIINRETHAVLWFLRTEFRCEKFSGFSYKIHKI